MAEPKNNSESLKSLLQELRKYGIGRFPALREDLEDLAADAIADLIAYSERAPAELTETDIRRLAFTIFKRRAIDALRKRAKDLGAQTALREEDDDRISPPDGEKRVLIGRMLRVCLKFWNEASPEDRRLFAVATGLEQRGGEHLNDRDRQRLHRLRERLSLAIRKELGEDAGSLLAG